jgi:F-type H+-transporting ATPase subunit a
MLAAIDLVKRFSDHPWPGWYAEPFGVPVTLMSSAIATMLMAAVALTALLVPTARRARLVPRGGYNVAELIVVFVRDLIARPALREKTYDYLPFLLTLFVFILAVNLFGVLPVEAVAQAAGLPPMGMPATSVPVVCGALAAMTLGAILLRGWRRQAGRLRRQRNWPAPACALLAPGTWLLGLAPQMGGTLGRLMAVAMVPLELIGVLMKCFSLMVRLFANILSGHALLAVLMMFILQALAGFLQQQAVHLFYVGPACILASVLVCLLELLVAALQAYIFTFLSALFLGMYAEGAH